MSNADGHAKNANALKEWCSAKVMKDGHKACHECPMVYMNNGCYIQNDGFIKCKLNNPFLWDGINVLYCPTNCAHMRLKEHIQYDKREGHFCEKYKQGILHGSAHPELNRCEKCIKEGLDGLETNDKSD